MEDKSSDIRIGCQGWSYADWKTKKAGETVLYPSGTKAGEMLGTYARLFRTVEVDSTFYAIPAFSTVEKWYKSTPGSFTFCLKLPQEITHVHKLGPDSYPVLESFCDRATDLAEKLGPVLIQMPPSFDGSRENAFNLRRFLKILPGDMRFAIEFRNSDWMIDWTFHELQRNDVACCLVEGPWIPRQIMFDAMPHLKRDLAYIRFMGERDLTIFSHIQRDRGSVLRLWAGQIYRLNIKEIYITLNNYFEGFAPQSAFSLIDLLGLTVPDPSVLESQSSLF